MNEEIKECSNKNHQYCGSIYPKDKVPITLFKKKCSNKPYNMCQDCRTHSKKYKKNINMKLIHKEKYKESINQNEELYCSGESHLTQSEYPRDKVPKKLFKKYPEHPNSPLLSKCEDCRKHHAKREYNRRSFLTEKAKENDKYWCSHCNKEIEQSERALNINGETSSVCNPCKIKETERFQILKQCQNNIKFEFIHDYQSCCHLCQHVFILNTDTNTVIDIETNLIGNQRYITYDNNTYLVTDFIEKYKNNVAWEILQFDHLPEQEQRERGLLKHDEKFVPKKKSVVSLRCEEDMRLEVLKCQLVCARCHLIITIIREKGKPYTDRSLLERKKLKYVNALKTEGCSLCHYKNDNLPRFFHFDHIDPTTKLYIIKNGYA